MKYRLYNENCVCCVDTEIKIDRAKEWLEEVVNQLYNGKDIDSFVFENCLDELCHLFDVKLPKKEIKEEELNQWKRVK